MNLIKKIKNIFCFFKKNFYIQNIITLFSILILEAAIILLWFFLNNQERKWYDVTSVVSSFFILSSFLFFIFNYKKNHRNIFPKSKILEKFKIKENENIPELTKFEKIQMQILDFNKNRKSEEKDKEINGFFIWINVFIFSFVFFIISITFLFISNF